MVYELKVKGMEARFFGGVAAASEGSTSATSKSNNSIRDNNDSNGGGEVMTAVGEGIKFKEDNFLTSANLCRWVIDFNDIQMGEQIGMGSYGVVYRGKWKGVEVAVKRFINQKLDERSVLEFRSEMAFLSELHHPNIVLFIGILGARATPLAPPLHFHFKALSKSADRHTLLICCCCCCYGPTTTTTTTNRSVSQAAQHVHPHRVHAIGQLGRHSAQWHHQARVEEATEDAAKCGRWGQLPALARAVRHSQGLETVKPARTCSLPCARCAACVRACVR
jgi:hypothetical protein